VLHGHVEALFNKAVLRVDVAAWADDRLGAHGLVNARASLGFEPLLARVEHHGILEVLVPRLVHRAGTFEIRGCFFVETGTWHLELETLAVEDLVVVESRGGGIEADTFARSSFVVSSSHAVLFPNSRIFNAGDLILNAEDLVSVDEVLSLLALSHDLLALPSVTLQDADSGIRCRVGQVKPVCG